MFIARFMVSASPADVAASKSDVSTTQAQIEELISSPSVQSSPRLQRQLALAKDVARQLADIIDVMDAATRTRAAGIVRLNAAVTRMRSAMAGAMASLGADAAGAETTLIGGLHQTGMFVASFAVFSLCMGVLCLVVMQRNCVRPLGDLVKSVRRLAQDELGVPIPHTKRSDEIGEVAQALETLRVGAISAKTAQRDAARFAEASAEERRTLVHASADATERALSDVVQSVGHTADHLSHAADEFSDIASRTSQHAASVVKISADGQLRAEKVVADADRFVSQIDAVKTRVSEAAVVMAQAARSAGETEIVVRSLAGAADGVDAVSRLIAQVAKRTQLLALNAAIEAARSGEAGRGFTVVATEVKALAVQTAAATERITRQVGIMRTAADGSAGRIDEIRGTIDSVNQLTVDVADALQEQHAFMQGFLVTADESANTAAEVANTMRDVLDNTSEVAVSAEGLRKVAIEVAAHGSTLDSELGKVLGHLRAA